jgi:elongation factor P
MASPSDIKNGMCIHFNHAPYQIMEFLHVKPGKGAAFVRTKLRNLNDRRVLEHTFPSGTKLEEVNIEIRTYQYLYNDGSDYHFMNVQTFEQIPMAEALINAPKLLKDGMECKVMFHVDEDRPMSVDLPKAVSLEVTYTEPGLKGDTATNTNKLATVETGAEIKVPLFINTGDSIVVLTADGTYKERAKK